jgi:hypothetical protein
MKREEREEDGGHEGTRSCKIIENQSRMSCIQLRMSFHHLSMSENQLIISWKKNEVKREIKFITERDSESSSREFQGRTIELKQKSSVIVVIVGYSV